jgi:hypothetical protein
MIQPLYAQQGPTTSALTPIERIRTSVAATTMARISFRNQITSSGAQTAQPNGPE